MRVFILASLTADGLISQDAHHLVDWSSKEDKKLFMHLTKEAGAFVMGANTFDTIGRALPGRRNIIYTSHPQKYADLGVETTSESPSRLVEQLSADGLASLAICGGQRVYTEWMQAGLVDELFLVVEPVLFGRGMTLFSQPISTPLTLYERQNLSDQTTLLRFSVHNT